MKRTVPTVKVGAVALILGLTLAGCAPTATTSGPAAGDKTAATTDEPKQWASAQEVIDSYDITELCGDEDLNLAFPAGITNPWMKQTYQMILNEAKKCPNIKDVQIVDAQVDQQKAVSDVNSLVAQGVDGIVTLPIFGAAQVPSFRSALTAGIPVVTFIADSGGAAGSDVTGHVTQDLKAYGSGWADWLGKNLKKGTVVFLGNAPGQPSSVAAFDAFAEALKAYPDLKLAEPEFQPTNNSAVEKKRVMTGLLAKHGRIDAVVTDNGAIDLSVIEAYQEAGLDLPYLANANTTNGLGCAWEKENFPLFSWDGSNDEGVVALRHLLSAVTGIETPEPWVVKPFVSVDTFAGVSVTCDASVSPDADWSTGLSAEQLKKVLG